MKTKRFLSLAAIFAVVFAFFACSSDDPSPPPSEPSSDSSGGNQMVFCKLTAGACSEMSLSTCMELVNAGAAQIVSNCEPEPPPPPPSSSSVPPPPPSSSSTTPLPSSTSTGPKCGGNEYNPSTYFCSGNTIVAKCGGNEYNPSTQFCSGNTVYTKCGGNEYNPSTHFCSGTTPVVRCGGKEYDPATQECTNNIVFSFFTDTRNNKKYKTVDIGTQTWMAENLTYSPPNNPPNSYNDDDQCPNKNNNNCATHGRLYSWVTAMQLSTAFKTTFLNTPDTRRQGVCPTGWHIPSDAEWTTLVTYVGANPGTKLKATSGWPSGANGTDNYGFAALPAGYVEVAPTPDVAHEFQIRGRWWTATDYNTNYAYNRMMGSAADETAGVYKIGPANYGNSQLKEDMLSVRCIKG